MKMKVFFAGGVIVPVMLKTVRRLSSSEDLSACLHQRMTHFVFNQVEIYFLLKYLPFFVLQTSMFSISFLRQNQQVAIQLV